MKKRQAIIRKGKTRNKVRKVIKNCVPASSRLYQLDVDFIVWHQRFICIILRFAANQDFFKPSVGTNYGIPAFKYSAV